MTPPFPLLAAADVAGRLAAAQDIAREAGALALAHFRNREALAVEHKGTQDVVSIADRAVEDLIRARLSARFPDDGFLGEETGGAGLDPGRPVWVVDPIDGTQPFLAGIQTWCVSIGLAQAGRVLLGVVFDPCADELFGGAAGVAATLNGRPITPAAAISLKDGMTEVGISFRVAPERTIRILHRLLKAGGIYHRGGSGALGLAYVAAGRYIAYYEEHMNSWDSLGAVGVLQASGAWCTDVLAGDGLTGGALAAACAPGLVAEFRRLIDLPEEA
jgi:myo-inositol-1(or 4)-monophosphatase